MHSALQPSCGLNGMQMAAKGWQSALQTETGGEGPEARFAWGHLMPRQGPRGGTVSSLGAL